MNTRWWRRSGIALMLCGLAACAGPRTAPTTRPVTEPAATGIESALDAVMTPAYRGNGPGASVIVVKDGRTVYRKAFGLANVELNVPMRPEHVFGIASLSKQFTAAAVLKLEEQGRLKVGDDIGLYLPSYPVHRGRITIEHLLTHTSGINGLSETSDLRAVPAQEGRLVDVLSEWVKDLPPEALPGTQWSYSNFGYNLLAAIVEDASGRPFPEYLQRELLDAAGMTSTFYNDRRRIIPLRATGYDAPGPETFNVLGVRSRLFHPAGAGSLLSTVDDLARWNAALAAGRILTPASLAKMFAPYTLKDGTSTRYGYGWDIGDDQGHRVYEHAGGTTGFVSHMVYMPDDHVFVCVLSNRASAPIPVQATAHRLAAIAAGRPIAEPQGIAVAPAALERLTGVYRGPDVGSCTVSLDKGRLLANVAGFEKLELVPVSPTEFKSRVVTWTFTFETPADNDGKATLVRVRDWKLDDVARRSTAVPAAAPVPVTLAPEALQVFSGDYEVLGGALASVVRSGDHLELRQAGQRPVELVAVAPAEFATRDGAITVRFARGVDGRVTGYSRWARGGSRVPARRLGLPRSAVSQLLLVSEEEARRIRAAVDRKEGASVGAVDRWRANAERLLAQGPWSVTFHRPSGVTAGLHDFFSEGPYWWPDPKNPGGPFIRRDGHVNPDRFEANDRDLSAMSEAVCDLGIAAWMSGDRRFADHAAAIVRTWFLDPRTRMNPNLEFGQAIRGVTTGRGIGIIDSVPLIWAVQGLVFLERSGLWNAADRDGVRAWFKEYLRWLTSSRKGLDEKLNGNNHSTWWAAQAAAYAIYVGDEPLQAMVWNFYRDYLVPAELRPDGSAPEEEARTKALGYSAMNLNGFALLCRLADRRGIDLWTYQTEEGASVMASAAYLAPFVENPGAWQKPQIEPYTPGHAYFLAVLGQALNRPAWVSAYRSRAVPDASWGRLLDLLLQ